MSSSTTAFPENSSMPMASFQYRHMNAGAEQIFADEPTEEITEPELRLTERAFAERLTAERAAGYAEAESKLRAESEKKTAQQQQNILQSISAFAEEQKNYFSRVESEVVQLALAIAGKILHREAQVDPMLIAAIVHLALVQLKEGSAASVRVRPEQVSMWREHVALLKLNLAVKVVEDAALERGDCVLETELGMVNFSLDAQLKEVERGFFDVLAQKPKV